MEANIPFRWKPLNLECFSSLVPSGGVYRVFFEPQFQEQCRGFRGFERGVSGSVGGSVGSSDDNVDVEGAVSGRFQAGGEREEQFQAGGEREE